MGISVGSMFARSAAVTLLLFFGLGSVQAQTPVERAESAATAAEAAVAQIERRDGDLAAARDQATGAAERAYAALREIKRAAKGKAEGSAEKQAQASAELAAARAGDAAKRALRLVPRGDELLDIFPYLGLGVDNFAASDTQRYLNPEDSGDTKTRDTFGVVFQYPLLGRSESRPFELWTYGQTTYGVRSAEVNCALTPDNAKCLEATGGAMPPNDQALYILRNATSLEGMLGLRIEFPIVQGGNASLYLSKQAGFVAVQDNDDDVADVGHVAFGARIREGRFRNSFLEIGKGRNDLFSENQSGRKKINARVVSRLAQGFSRADAILARAFFFAQVSVDVDGASGADSVQTYIGVAFCPWGNGRCGYQ